VPETADHVRPARIATFEHDQHFVVDIRNKPATAIVPGHERREPRPRLVTRARRVRRPWQRDLHASESFGIDDVCHERGKCAVPATAETARQSHIEDHFEWWLFHRLLPNPESF